MLRRVVAASRYLVLIPVVCVALASAAIFVYGAILTGIVVLRPISDGVGGTSTKALMLGTIELVDLFLLGTTLYVVAIGLYELFVDEDLPSPKWLAIHDLDDLKAKILGVVIVILVVLFLGQVIAGGDGRDLLSTGGAIALVIAAATFFLGQHSRHGGDPSSTP